MTEKEKGDLAHDAYAKFSELSSKGGPLGGEPLRGLLGQPYTFAFREYAVRVVNQGEFYALSIWDSKGRFVNKYYSQYELYDGYSTQQTKISEWNRAVEAALGECFIARSVSQHPRSVQYDEFSPWTQIEHAHWGLDELKKQYPDMTVQMVLAQRAHVWNVWIHPEQVVDYSIYVGQSEHLREAICKAIVRQVENMKRAEPRQPMNPDRP